MSPYAWSLYFLMCGWYWCVWKPELLVQPVSLLATCHGWFGVRWLIWYPNLTLSCDSCFGVILNLNLNLEMSGAQTTSSTTGSDYPNCVSLEEFDCSGTSLKVDYQSSFPNLFLLSHWMYVLNCCNINELGHDVEVGLDEDSIRWQRLCCADMGLELWCLLEECWDPRRDSQPCSIRWRAHHQ